MRFLFLLLIIFCGNFLLAQPANDACINATLIPNVSNFCSSNNAGSILAATDDASTSGGYGAASCWGSGAINDVWYKFIAIASDVSITIIGNEGVPASGTLNRPQVALYGGSCSSSISEMACGSAPAGQNIIQIYKAGLTIGQTYLIRVDGYNAFKGTFQYCINNYNPVPSPEGDCPSAVVLCDNSSFTVPAVSGVGSIATEMNDAVCFDYDPSTGNIESNSTWYVFSFATSGTFNFNIVPSNINDDIDFALYRLPNGVGNCSGKQTVRCEAASCFGATGIRASSSDISEPPGCSWPSDNYVSQVNVTAGQTYALAINNFTSTGNGFSISFGGTAMFQGPTATINDSDADDIICPGESITFSQTSAPPPTGSLISWKWNFGVGATPAIHNGPTPPAVSYIGNGVKTISLTVESNQGCLYTITKNITVASTPPTVNISASKNPICQGESVTFTATPNNAGANPTYQWYLNNIPVGTNSNTYTNTSSVQGDQIKVQVTSNALCNAGLQVTSSIITMTVNAPKIVAVAISGQSSICSGEATTLTATPTNGGANPVYQWFVNGNPVGTNGNNYLYSSTISGEIVTVRLTSNASCITNNPTLSSNFPMMVKPKPTVTATNPSICSGDQATLLASGATSYTWTGGLQPISNPTTPALSTNTTYTVTGTTNGCSNTATSTVTVKPKPNVTTTSVAICNGEQATLLASGASTYTWSGGLASVANPTTPILTSTTTYTVTGTTNGCSNTATSTVTVKPKPVVTVNAPSICTGQTATLQASGATTYSWNGGLPSISNPTTPILTNNTTYTVTGTTNGCNSDIVLATVTVKPKPTVTATNPSICSGEQATLLASGATSYTWTGGLQPISNPTTPALTTTTTYTVTGTTNGCSNSATSTVTVKPRPTITVNTPETCSGHSATLIASGANSYIWSDGLPSVPNPITPVLINNTTYTVTGTMNGCSASKQATVIVHPNKITNISKSICSNQSITVGTQTFNTSGTHTVVLQSSKNCDSTVILDLSIIPIITPSVSITADKNNICIGEPVQFNASTQNTNGTIVYKWFVNGQQVGTNSAQFTSTQLKDNDKVSAVITITNSTCLSSNIDTSNSIIIHVTKPSYTIPKIEYCYGKSGLIDIGLTIPLYSILWKNVNDTVTRNNTDTFTVSNTANSTIQFTVKYNTFCTFTDIVPIKVFPLPIIDAIVDRTLVRPNTTVQLDVVGNNILSYIWQPASAFLDNTIKNPTSVVTQPTTFSVVVTDKNTCENIDTVSVNVIDVCAADYIFFPSAFSPNNDGTNDCFGIVSPPDLSNYKMVIFNRWGERVFETSDKNECWEGHFKNTDVSADSYIYAVSFICSNGKSVSKKGAVTLLR